MRPSFFIAIALLGFGLFFNILSPTGLGIFDVAPLDVSNGFDSSMVTELTEASASAQNNPVGGFTNLASLVSVVFGGVMNILFIVPIATALGLNFVVASALNIMLIFIYVIDLALFVRGLSV